MTDGGGAADDAAERCAGWREGRPMADRSGWKIGGSRWKIGGSRWKIGGSRWKIKMSPGCLVNESVSQVDEICRLVKAPELRAVESAQAVVAAGYVTETMDVAQGKLCMGFATPVTLRDKGFVATQLFNTIFGGGMISKLFMKVREEMSLCYDIGSSYHGSKGIITVSAGIDNNKDKPVRQEILRQLEACQRGEFTEQELEAAKQAILSQLKSTHDSPGAIEGFYGTAALSGMPLTPEEYIREVEKATAEDVAWAAKQVKPHTVYFLRGDA